MSGICFQFRDKGFCRFGDTCRFNHGEGAGAPAGGAPGGGYGGGYGGGRKSGPCYEFRDNGSCKYGQRCRFYHEEGEQKQYAPKPQQPYCPPVRPSGGGGGGAGICYIWRDEGTCAYGDNCRFQHGDADARDLSFNAQRKRAGPCFQFRDSGSCTFGDQCRFSHDADEAAPAMPQEAAVAPPQEDAAPAAEAQF